MRRSQIARAVLTRYPFPRGRLRLAALLLSSNPWGSHEGPPGVVLESLPAGDVVDCKHDLRIRLRRDEAYVGLYLHGAYEIANTRLYRRLVSPGQVVFDVGASFGWFTALFARAVGPGGAVHAFEPVPDLADLAADTIELNGVGSVVRMNVAGLGASVGEFVVYTFPGLPLGHASASDLHRADARAHRCRLTTIDRYVRETGVERIDFLKVDVEGHERDVFLGGRETLAREDGPIVAFEVNRECLRQRSLDAAAVLRPLREAGYTRLWAIDRRKGLHAVDRLFDNHTSDYVAAKGEAVETVERAAR